MSPVYTWLSGMARSRTSTRTTVGTPIAPYVGRMLTGGLTDLTDNYGFGFDERRKISEKILHGEVTFRYAKRLMSVV